MRRRQLSRAEKTVLAAVIESPDWGLALCERTGLGTGSVYPALDRLMKRGLISDRWEDAPPGSTLRRRFYDPVYAPWWYKQNGILEAEAS